MYEYEERYKSVQELKAQGLGIKPIQRELGMGRNTVRVYYYATNPEELKSKRKSTPRRVYTECRTCGEAFERPRRSAKCSACQARRRAISAQYDALLAKQGNQCGICQRPETKTARFGNTRKLSVDERHGALLCGACINLLGFFQHDPDLLDAASAYLSEHSTTKNPWQQPAEAVQDPDEHLAERTRQVIEWRSEGVYFKEIGRRLGVSKQRAVQIWQRTQAAAPLVRTCWCGNAIPERAESGRPRHACSDEHARRSGNPSAAPNIWYAEQLAQQDGKCAICRQPETIRDGRNDVLKELAADHNHTTGAYRALLCGRCNTGLGQASEDPAIFAAASNYTRAGQAGKAA